MVKLVYFSPTGGTKAYGEYLCECLLENGCEEDVFVFAMPVFGGRIPEVASNKVRQLDGQGKKAITMVVYGTRAYEDALLELNNVVKESHFEIIASAAVVAEHSIVPEVGQGRPDQDDFNSIKQFSKQIIDKMKSHIYTPVTVPGNFPYKEGMTTAFTPISLPDCIQCGKCALVCPTHAMHIEADGIKTDVEACILCMACTASCPSHARILPPPVTQNMKDKLSPLIPIHKENEYFL